MRDLEPVAGFLDQVLRKLGMPDPVDLLRLVDEWPDVAGEPWGTRSRPAGLTDGELLVEGPGLQRVPQGLEVLADRVQLLRRVHHPAAAQQQLARCALRRHWASRCMPLSR